jgi:S1-C subfamily serine protease
MEFGNVQRAILGVEGGELNATAPENLELNQTEGFILVRWTKTQALKRSDSKGDIIVKLDNQKIATLQIFRDILILKTQ